jgi:hypothetical protein
MKKCFLLLLALLASSAQAGQDCTDNPYRMAEMEANIQRCVLGTGSPVARHYILYGRYNGNFFTMIKKGYGQCTEIHDAWKNFGVCDDASFWVAANKALPSEDYAKYPEAKRPPEDTK